MGLTNFETALNFVLAEEGGYTCDPRDPGGETNMGISKRMYPGVDIKNLTIAQAAAIYKKDYWDANKLEPMPQVWQLFLFDSYVQHSPHVVQQFIAGNASIADAMWARLAFYAGLTTFQDFGKGWVKRMCHLRKALRVLNAQV